MAAKWRVKALKDIRCTRDGCTEIIFEGSVTEVENSEQLPHLLNEYTVREGFEKSLNQDLGRIVNYRNGDFQINKIG